MATAPQLLAVRAAEDPERPAFIVDGVGSVTFLEWERRSNAVAAGLLGRGLERGDRVGLIFGGRGWIDFAISYFAVQKAGGVAVPLSDRFPATELTTMLADCAASALLHERGGTPPSTDAWTATPEDLDGGHTDVVDAGVSADDLAQILYTSGTTGRPKGVGASHANVTFGCTRDRRRRPLAHSQHFLHAFPIGTNAGQAMLLNALDARPTALTLPQFTPGRFARLIESSSVGTVFVVPSMAIELLNTRVHERYDLTSVRLLGSTAAALPPPVAVALAEVFPNATIVNYYTSTEAWPAQTAMIFDPGRATSVGRPTSPRDIVISRKGTEPAPVPPGETGEVWLRSPTAPRAYYGDHAPGSSVFHGRWIRMGDVGYLDEDGYLHILDRESDVIKSGAFKISTLKVEAALLEHPSISEAAVFGIPHAVLGAQIVAAVVSPLTLSLRDVRTFLVARLAEHELPQRVLMLESLPKNAAGKVLKRELRELVPVS